MDAWRLYFYYDLINSSVPWIYISSLWLSAHDILQGDKVWYVECEIIILNPNQPNELFQRTEIVPSVLIWPSSAQRELGEINKWHLFKIALQQKLSYTTAYNEDF